MKPSRLRCCSVVDPVGIDRDCPDLSWEFDGVTHGSSMQTAYRICVADSLEGLNAPNLWDSGRVVSDRNTAVPYEGMPLKSRQWCFWLVEIWDEAGQVFVSAPGQWQMGLLREDDWSAGWIGMERNYPNSRRMKWRDQITQAHWIWAKSPDDMPRLGAVEFEKCFSIEGDELAAIRGVWLEVLAAANAEVELNGMPICRADRARAWVANSPIPVPIWVPASRLRVGENRLRVVAEARSGNASDPHETSPGLIATLGFEASDKGPSRLITTDASWISTDGNGVEFRTEVLGPWGCIPWHKVMHAEYRAAPARYLRNEFFLPSHPVGAMLYLSGLGLSEAWLNGRRVSDEVLSPLATDYDRSVSYRCHDVTEFLQVGKNAAGVILGNGHWNPPRAEVPFPTRFFGYPKLLWQLEVTCADGSNHRVVSSSKWRITDRGPLGANSEFDGEEYHDDAAFDGWASVGFPAEEWHPAERVAAPGGRLKAQLAPPIRITGRLQPVSMIRTKYGSTLVDFGRNLTGWCAVRASGATGTRLRLRHAETLETPDALALDNLRTALCLDTATLGNRPLEWSPRFTFHGFRYVEIRIEEGAVENLEVEACVVHNDVERLGEFACSNATLNSIVQAARHGILSSYQGFPLDCPQRDERMPWLGDRSRGCCGEMWLYDINALFAKWVEDIVEAQLPSGSVPDIAPAYWRLYNNSITWPSTIVFVPWYLLRQYGDEATVRRHYPAIRRWIRYALGMMEDGIIEKDTYGDWCVPPESPELIHSRDASRMCHPAILSSCTMRQALVLGAGMARLCGEADDAERWEAEAAAIAESVHRRFFDAARGCYDNGSQTAALLPLATGTVPEAQRESVAGYLADKIGAGDDPKIGVGLVGVGWLMRTLVEHGRSDLAFAIATRTEYPGWGYMIENGATTIWELWNGNKARPDMNSGNHVMLLGDLIPYLFEDLAGLSPAAPGFRRLRLHPQFPEGLEWVKASYRSPNGLLCSAWKRQGRVVEWELTIPGNTTAEVIAPGGWRVKAGQPAVLSGGKHGLSLERAE